MLNYNKTLLGSQNFLSRVRVLFEPKRTDKHRERANHPHNQNKQEESDWVLREKKVKKKFGISQSHKQKSESKYRNEQTKKSKKVRMGGGERKRIQRDVGKR